MTSSPESIAELASRRGDCKESTGQESTGKEGTGKKSTGKKSTGQEGTGNRDTWRRLGYICDIVTVGAVSRRVRQGR